MYSCRMTIPHSLSHTMCQAGWRVKEIGKQKKIEQKLGGYKKILKK